MTKKKTRDQAWDTIRKSAMDEDMKEILAMSDEELDAEIRKAGGDPKEIEASTGALIERLSERRKRLGWQTEVAIAEAEFQKRREELAARRVKLSRDELKRRIQVAKADPRWAQPVAALFRDRTTEESTDEELQIILEQLELLKEMADKKNTP